jgi:RNA polymerase sigma-70 factor, ECF subfamily
MDNQLISQALAGDNSAFDQVVSHYLPDIYRFVYWITHDTKSAEDITQDTFIKAWQNLKKFDTQKPFKPWLLRIAHNCAIDHLRKKSFTPFTHLSEAEQALIHQQPNSSPSPEQTTHLNEQNLHIQIALDSLPIKYKEVLVLNYLEGYSASEIGVILKISHETVRTRLRRARILFRKKYHVSR